MLRGIYTGASGMIAQQARMDVVANNLANVDKTGFKKDLAIFKAFPDMLIRRDHDNGLGVTPAGSYDTMPLVGKLGTGVEVNEVYTEFDQGSLQRTENNFDLALDGRGFMTVQTERGERYTRNGAFTINQDGILMTHNGYPVVGENGIIRVQQNNFIVNERGEVIVNARLQPDRHGEHGEQRLEPARGAGPAQARRFREDHASSKRKATRSGRRPSIPARRYPPASIKVVQGFLEKSNVNMIREMVDMIEVQRSYEANQKTVQTHDQTVGRLINEVIR